MREFWKRICPWPTSNIEDFNKCLELAKAALEATGLNEAPNCNQARRDLYAQNRSFIWRMTTSDKVELHWMQHDLTHVFTSSVRPESDMLEFKITEGVPLYIQSILFPDNLVNSERDYDIDFNTNNIKQRAHIIRGMFQSVFGNSIDVAITKELSQIPLALLGLEPVKSPDGFTDYILIDQKRRHDFLKFYQKLCEDNDINVTINPSALGESTEKLYLYPEAA